MKFMDNAIMGLVRYRKSIETPALHDMDFKVFMSFPQSINDSTIYLIFLYNLKQKIQWGERNLKDHCMLYFKLVLRWKMGTF